MTAEKALTLSLVIPVYNEEDHLKACLEAIAAQTIKPHQVLVVDNNSTDHSVAIAKSYPFVTLLREPRQHQVFAQAAGFETNTADIIARIDADTVLPIHWAERIIEHFRTMPKVIAVTGGADPYDVPLHRIGSWIFRTYHETLSSKIAGHPMLWGSNMAFRAQLWPRLRTEMHMRADLWEDYDMSFHLNHHGVIFFDDDLKVRCSFRAAHKPLAHQFRYQLRVVRTFRLHTSLLRTALFALAWSTIVLYAALPIIDRNLWRLQQYRKRRLKGRR